jgi:hypothetical protein
MSPVAHTNPAMATGSRIKPRRSDHEIEGPAPAFPPADDRRWPPGLRGRRVEQTD